VLKTETASISGVDPYIVMAISQLETNDYNSDFFSGILTGLLPFFMQLMFVLPLYRMLDRVVGEKNSRIRESMRMMGLKDSAYWLSWFVYYLIINTFIAIFALIILGIQVMPNTDKFLLFLFFWCFGLSLFGYAVFTSALFWSPKAAAIGGTILYFTSGNIDILVADASTPEGNKLAASILPTVAVGRAAAVLSAYEGSGIGLSFDNAMISY